MKSLQMLMLLFAVAFCSFGQNNSPIVSVGTAEYLTTYLHADGSAGYNQFNNGPTSPPTYTKVPGGKYESVDGGQYQCSFKDSSGNVFTINNQNGFRKNNLPLADKIYSFFQSTIALSGGKLYIDGTDNIMLFSSFNHPTGVIFTDVVVSTGSEYDSKTKVRAIATDGSVWVYTRGNPNAVKYTAVSGVRKITTVGIMAVVYITDNDMLVTTDYFYSNYVGANWGVTSPTSVKAVWLNAGAKWPFKEVKGNYNTLHIIDAEDNMFGSGSNTQGEIGNGLMYDWKSVGYKASWANGLMVTSPTRIPGKWKNLCKSNSIAFYVWAQDFNNNWHSWGRNKRQTLGNGITLPQWNVGTWIGEGDLPDLLNVPSPKFVEPNLVKYTVVRFDGNKVPVAPDRPYPVAAPIVIASVPKPYYDSVVAVYKNDIWILQSLSQSLLQELTASELKLKNTLVEVAALKTKIAERESIISRAIKLLQE